MVESVFVVVVVVEGLAVVAGVVADFTAEGNECSSGDDKDLAR